jgi:ubiquitin carboxyl-terminal hydrolase 5/13
MAMDIIELVRSAMKQGLKVPHGHEKIFKDECCFSYATPESEGGLYINLKTFQVRNGCV